MVLQLSGSEFKKKGSQILLDSEFEKRAPKSSNVLSSIKRFLDPSKPRVPTLRKRVPSSSKILSPSFIGYLRFRVTILVNRDPDSNLEKGCTSSSFPSDFQVLNQRGGAYFFPLPPEFQVPSLTERSPSFLIPLVPGSELNREGHGLNSDSVLFCSKIYI